MEPLTDYLLNSPIIMVVSFLTVSALIANAVFRTKHDPKEPPLIAPSIPIVGHIWGLWYHGSRYLVRFAKKYRYPIYTLKVPFGKVYIACQPEVITAIEKNPKAVAFSPLAANVISRLSDASAKAKEVMFENMIGEDGEHGYFIEITKEVHGTLRPGASLANMVASVARTTTSSIAEFHGKTTRIDLLEWVRHAFSMGSTNAVYGPMNPFKDPAVESGFWAFDGGVSTLIFSVLPNITCRQAHNGRVRAWNGFEKYYLNDGHEQASDLARARYNIARSKGVPIKDIAKLEVTMIIGILTNTVPSGFWMIFYMYSQPTLLGELRVELDRVIELENDSSAEHTHILNLHRIKAECPLLNAVWQEVLRTTTCGISSRIVTRDILLNDRFLLKKNSVVELPNHVTHSNPELWGPTVDEFDPRRFLKAEGKATEAETANSHHKIPRATFRPFGGGTSLCSGRHQATNQLLGAMAMFVTGYEVKPAKGDGKWVHPGAHGHTIAAAVDSPDCDIAVEVMPRAGYEEAKWVLTTTGSNE